MNLKNCIKNFITLGIFLLFPSTTLAATFPATCPAEAQAIVGAVGGCGSISADQYASIYSKCCSTTQQQQPAIITTTNTTKKTVRKYVASPKPIPLQPIQPLVEQTTPVLQMPTITPTTSPQTAHTALLFVGSAIGGIGFWCLIIIFFVKIIKFIIRKFSKNKSAQPSPKIDIANNVAMGLFILGIIIATLAIVIK